MNLFTCRPKYLAGLYILLVDDLTIPAHTKSTLYVQSFVFIIIIRLLVGCVFG